LKITSFILFIITANLLAGCNSKLESNNKEVGEKIIKIGVVADLTGYYANLLRGTERGVNLAIQDLYNQNISAIIEDAESCNPEKATTIINKLTNIDQVDFIIGGNCSNITLAMAPIANHAQTIMISPGASAPSVSQAGDYVFRTYISDIEKALRVARLAYGQGYEKIAVITEKSNQAMIELSHGLINEYKRLGGNILIEENIDNQDKDFQTILTKIKERNPQVLFINSTNPNQIGLVIRQSGEMGLQTKFMTASETAEDEAVINIADQLAEGLIYAKAGNPPKSEQYLSLVKKYQEQYQEEEIPLTLLEAYDATMLGVKAVLASDETREDIKNKLYEVSKTYQGVSGNIEFDENGDVHKDLMFKTVKDGKFVEYIP